MKWYSFAVLLALSPILAYAQPRQWLSLGHYDKTIWGYKSRVEAGSPFFLAPDGPTNPETERQATVQMFERGEGQCSFPARFEYFLRNGGNAERRDCEEFEKWRAKIGDGDLILVFASQFLSNPASSMGHTFLKVRKPGGEEFLDLTLGYAADIPDHTGALAYAYKGIVGGFDGTFSVTPYFRKVHEYAVIERRDLWEFTLKLTQSEKDFFFKHIWELTHNAKINYHFLDENCSFVLLAALQAALPDKDLLSGNWLYVPPIETVKTLERNGLIVREGYRPSLRSQLDFKLAALDDGEYRTVTDAVRYERAPKSEQPKVYDALLNYLALERQMHENKLNPKSKEFEKEVLLARSQIPGRLDYKAPQPASPLTSHPPHHIEVGGGTVDDRSQVFITLRPAAHDFMDKDNGFSKNSAFNLMNGTIAYSEGGTKLTQLTLLEVRNQPDFDWINNDMALGLFAGYENDNIKIEPEFGLAFTPFKKWHVAILTFLSYTDELRPGLRFEQVFRPVRDVKWFVRSDVSTEPIHDSGSLLVLSSEVRLYDLLRNLDLGAEANFQQQLNNGDNIASLNIKSVFGF